MSIILISMLVGFVLGFGLGFIVVCYACGADGKILK